MTQGIFVGHHDRTGAVLCIIKNGVVPSTSSTRQPNWDGLCGTPWQMVEPKVTRKVPTDNGAETPLPRIAVSRIPEVEPRRFYVLSVDIEVRGHTGGCPGCAALVSHSDKTTVDVENEPERSSTEP